MDNVKHSQSPVPEHAPDLWGQSCYFPEIPSSTCISASVMAAHKDCSGYLDGALVLVSCKPSWSHLQRRFCSLPGFCSSLSVCSFSVPPVHSLGAACVLERSTTPEGRSYFILSISSHSKSKRIVKTRTKTRHSEPSALPQAQAELSSQHSMLGEKPDQRQGFPVLLRPFSYCPAGVFRLQITAYCRGKKRTTKILPVQGKLVHTQRVPFCSPFVFSVW